MVLCRQRQKRADASRPGREHVFGTVTAVDPGLVARRSTATGAGLGCNDAQETLHGALHQRGVSGLCHSSGLESGGRGAKGRLATVLAGPAAAPLELWSAPPDVDPDEASR